ncbi:related to YEH1-steryl ester hydrolase [Ustilago bromivora]|uniref:sterol esterase n=1 Tax=Ustilago bromivora TaxID=307758 RepID=A0A1K0HD06_9BASI|nr:related to YEH1-steryl ester hydrolase [Ustilago bromivora]SYW80328.1 related to YEH1 - steryl ester hydrolase [Ustilago bromivora]
MSNSNPRSLRAEASSSSAASSKSPGSQGLSIDGNLISLDTAAASALSDYIRTSTNEPISRPSSAASMRIRVDKLSSEAISGRALYTHVPTGFEQDPLLHPYHSDDQQTGASRSSSKSQRKRRYSNANGKPRRSTHDSVVTTFARRGGAPPYSRPTLYSTGRLFVAQTTANVLSSFFLFLVVLWALSVRLLAAIPKFFAPTVKEQKEWDDPKRWSKEKLVKDVRYYAASCGFEIINETVQTQDGYYLRIHRIIDPQTTHKKHSDGRRGFPVLIMHGLFQSSGSFVTSEERSLPFWLARHGGYQVFLGNNRGVFDMGHRTYKRSDPRFWDYNIRELAIYDLPAMIDYICKETGYDRIAYIGHSQGNGTMFISLSKGMLPELGNKLTYFGALAPAVYAGPLTSCFPFTTLGQLEWPKWKRFFGVLDFIPLMKISYDCTPAYPYALLGYQMFAFLFAWTDANWLLRRKAKMFRFTPQPVSSASIYWWAGKDGFASRGCVLDPSLDQWWDENFPPLSIFSGGMDFLVLADPLIERIEQREKHVKLLRFKRQDEAEHCDHFWAADAVEWCFEDILEDIERTRTRYPEELDEERKQNENRGAEANGQELVDV